jgi:release factor glutamine methyltransferase
LHDARVVATDTSLGALAVARHNARRLGVDHRVFLTCSHWLAGVQPAAIDLVVANPPYIAEIDAATLSPEITDFEPHEALFSGVDGMRSYRQLFAELVSLRPGTRVLCEVGHEQASAVAGLASELGFVHQRTLEDYAGISRVVVVIRS